MSDTRQRDELAREIFVTDNARSQDPAALWDEADHERMHYAEVIADGLITKGYRKVDPADEAVIDKVAAALAKADGWLSLVHPSPRHQTLLRERARAILTVLHAPEAEATNVDFALATATAAGVFLTEEQVREYIARGTEPEAEATR